MHMTTVAGRGMTSLQTGAENLTTTSDSPAVAAETEAETAENDNDDENTYSSNG